MKSIKKERNEITELLKHYGRTLRPEEAGRKRALNFIEQAAAEKKIRQKHFPLELLVTEMQYISPLFWLLQGALVATLIFWVGRTSLREGVLTDYLRWSSVGAAWFGVTVCGDLGRHLSKNMAELEQSCYFNLLQMWTIKLILSGTVDILILMLCCGGIAINTRMPFGQVCLYLLVPFVLSNVCCLLIFTALRGGRGRWCCGQLMLATFTGAVVLVPDRVPGIYTLRFLWIWILLLAVGMGLFVWQIKLVREKIGRGELVCWN